MASPVPGRAGSDIREVKNLISHEGEGPSWVQCPLHAMVSFRVLKSGVISSVLRACTMETACKVQSRGQCPDTQETLSVGTLQHLL
jgi:hypothetical protein